MDTGLIILSLQSHPGLLPFMRAASLLGVLELYLLILPAVYWCFDRRLGLRMALILVVSQSINYALKAAFHLPRPYWVIPEVKAFSGEASFGLPSGHAQNAVCVWGMLACYARASWVRAVLLLLIALISVSRLYLGVHFPGDVLAGWAIGALILLLFMVLDRPVSNWLGGRSLAGQVGASLLASLALLSAYALAQASLGEWQTPEVWIENALKSGVALDPLNPEGILAAAGMVLGIGTGAAVLQGRGNFDPHGPAAKCLLRYVLGMIILALTWYGLGALAHGLDSPMAHIMYYLRSLLAGAFVAGAAPLLFVKLGLAEKEQSA
ncbi:MAG: phosphatase PAP2 family protein [Methanotrichaceae archaeon]|nr:phosphatase PAP2 family protein [Methanotrichaceae archaeon]